MYASRLILNLKNGGVQRELANIYELHRTIMSAFPDSLEGPGRVLFRVEPRKDMGVVVLVNSTKAPSWKKLDVPAMFFLSPPDFKEFNPRIAEGQQFLFKLLANPTVRREGKRLGIFGMDEQMTWLARKSKEHGFSLRRVTAIPRHAVKAAKPGGTSMKFAAVTFQGVLKVEDSERFKNTLEAGIGSGKGLGFGMLSIAKLKSAW